jgi:hypothetical protein
MANISAPGARPALAARPGGTALRWAIRLAGAGLLLGNAWIHEHLHDNGYATVPTIGPLFRLDAALATAAAIVVLVAPGVWFALACAAGALLQLGTLAALAASLTVGTFGFKESLDAPLLIQSVVVELLGAAVLALGAWLYAPRDGSWRWALRRSRGAGADVR